MHVKGFTDQTHMCTLTQTNTTWVLGGASKREAPPVSSPGLFQGWRSAGMVGVANGAEAEGAAAQGLVCLRGAATSTAGCY